MPTSGPIVIIEDDDDDQEFLKTVFKELSIPNPTRFFNSCLKALDYLATTIERPFIIISDINIPQMTGLELKLAINMNENLRNKCIPFIFLTTNPDHTIISKAYASLVHGYFVKPPTMNDLKEMMQMILHYWKTSQRPGE
jgi:CheY-like chemotaxis protein